MSRFQNERGVLLPTPKDKDGRKGGRYHGSIRVGGKRYELSAIPSKSRYGGRLLVLTAKPMREAE